MIVDFTTLSLYKLIKESKYYILILLIRTLLGMERFYAGKKSNIRNFIYIL
jgi:hypothetical protein